jgi:hypothetical protein
MTTDSAFDDDDDKLDFDEVDKDYQRLLALLGDTDPRHVWMILSAALIHVTRIREVSAEVMLDSLCKVWNLSSEDDTFISVLKVPVSSFADGDESVH